MARLLLFRHGESTWNLEGRIQGQHYCPLTRTGRAQAQELGHKLKNLQYPLDFVHSSGLERADMTARIAMAVANPQAPIHSYPALKERNWGALQGRKGEDIKGERDRYLAWDAIPDQGESFIEVEQRTLQYLENVALPLLRDGKTLICFSHAGALATLQCRIEALSWRDPKVRTPNAGGRVYHWIDDQLILETILD